MVFLKYENELYGDLYNKIVDNVCVIYLVFIF